MTLGTNYYKTFKKKIPKEEILFCVKGYSVEKTRRSIERCAKNTIHKVK